MAEVIDNRKDLETVTPMMQQYLEVKAQYEGYILFYRLGDFYECFFEDAVLVSREMELTLTARDCGGGKRAAMCGVPFHKSDVYVARLVERGFKVAICEQVEDPKSAQGLVRRDVTRVVTPGTVTDGEMLNEGKNNFLAALCYGTLGVALSAADVSTGEVFVTFFGKETPPSVLESELAVYQPAELILFDEANQSAAITHSLKDKYNTFITDNESALFDYDRAKNAMLRFFMKESEKLDAPEMVMAVGALLLYIQKTQKTEIAFVKELRVYSKGQYLELDYNTRRNLELCEAMRTKEKRGSLLWVLDKTKTAMGARLLRSFVLKPLLDPVVISHRQAMVSAFVKDSELRADMAEALSTVLDIERLTAKAVYGTANARDLRAIAVSIACLPAVKNMLMDSENEALVAFAAALDPLTDICDLLMRAIADAPPLTVREGGMIRDGFHSEVDYYRHIKNDSTEIMASIEEREKEETGIRTLKVSYNKVFGYYIEVSKSFVDSVPDRYVRKQTLVNCERYITQELKEMEGTIFSAEEKLCTLEFEIFSELREMICQQNERIRAAASVLAAVDVYRSLAEVADKNSFVCPEVDLSTDLYIKDGRHPVVERFVTDNYFVPNDTVLDTAANRMMIITGPNMAGKSTYMRQVALIVLMAQIGSFVPAREARVGIVDKVFTRVGASDDLASGQSTFMLEMTEVSAILKNATKRSLIVYDEVGRGTSTYDGMSIARAVVEYTHSKKIGAKTLFATHYHELTEMEEQFEGIVNYNIAAKKRADSITFLRKIVRGGTDDSYGIEVAKLAGLPNEVIKRAREILAEIEAGGPQRSAPAPKKESEPDLFSALTAGKDQEAADQIRAADLNTMTPIEAMNLLFSLKKLLS